MQGLCGIQGLCAVRPLREEADIFDRDLDRAEVFCREMAEKLGLRLIAADYPRSCSMPTWCVR